MNRIVRASLLLVAVAGIGSLVVFSYSARHQSPRSQPERPPARSTDSERGAVAPPQVAEHNAHQAAAAPPKPVTESSRSVSPEVVARWIAAATGSDAKARAAAITSLAQAPKSQAVPVLKTILNAGDPQVDRQLALSSLHVLALEQGDGDGRIRGALRDAIYHGDDASVGQSAQTILEDIESEACLGSTENACDPAN